MRKKAYLFVFGASSTLLLSIFLFVALPRWQFEEVKRPLLSAQEPYTASQQLGRRTYIEYGCVYCHSQQVRDPSVAADGHFGWGRPSLPSDYLFDKPHLLGTMRTGPDLSNIGSRQPSREWHHLHLYNPRLLVKWSVMPDFSFLYTRIPEPAVGALQHPQEEGVWLQPSEKAEALVDYLASLKRDRQPQPVKGALP